MEENNGYHGYLSLNSQHIELPKVQIQHQPITISPEQKQVMNEALRQAREMSPISMSVPLTPTLHAGRIKKRRVKG